jgi:hypothetical protein
MVSVAFTLVALVVFGYVKEGISRFPEQPLAVTRR